MGDYPVLVPFSCWWALVAYERRDWRRCRCSSAAWRRGLSAKGIEGPRKGQQPPEQDSVGPRGTSLQAARPHGHHFWSARAPAIRAMELAGERRAIWSIVLTVIAAQAARGCISGALARGRPRRLAVRLLILRCLIRLARNPSEAPSLTARRQRWRGGRWRQRLLRPGNALHV